MITILIRLLITHPNPAKDYFIASYNTHGSTKMQLQIFDMNSRLIQTHQLVGKDQLVIDIRDLPAGVYMVNLIEGKTFVESHKLTIVN
ncbi:MAG: T9SS type A sorting domain-containing protein [Bacteroidales bacterium]|nr:T9SS type A sorting domain-containing protein [Bacteroidales bacterium]